MINRAPWPAALGVLAVLAACSGDGQPATLPDVGASSAESPLTASPTPTPEPTPTATVEPPVEPANAHEYSEEGVEAFTRYAIDVINYAYQTNDVAPLEQIMTPDCETCANTISRLTTIDEAGGRVEGGWMVPRRFSVSGPAEGVQTSAAVDLVLTASRTINGLGEVTNTEEERTRRFIFNLLREGEVWRLDEVFRTDDRQS